MHYLFFIIMLCLTSIASAATDESAKTFSHSPLATVNLIQTLLGLILVLGCIVLVAWLLKRSNRFHTTINGQLKVIAGLPLGTKERLILVQVGSEQVLLGVTSQQITLLNKLETPISTDQSDKRDFAEKLKDMVQKRGES